MNVCVLNIFLFHSVCPGKDTIKHWINIFASEYKLRHQSTHLLRAFNTESSMMQNFTLTWKLTLLAQKLSEQFLGIKLMGKSSQIILQIKPACRHFDEIPLLCKLLATTPKLSSFDVTRLKKKDCKFIQDKNNLVIDFIWEFKANKRYTMPIPKAWYLTDLLKRDCKLVIQTSISIN